MREQDKTRKCNWRACEVRGGDRKRFEGNRGNKEERKDYKAEEL